MEKIFGDLLKATRLAHIEDDLPDFLAVKIFYLVENKVKYIDKQIIVHELIHQISNYNTYSEAGCCKTDFSAEDIKITLNRLR